MNELIKITKKDGNDVISARELHEFLEIGNDFTTWCKRMFDYGFSEGIDYSFLKNGEQDNQVVMNPKPKTDYALTLDCAKEIAMIQRTDKGKQARIYFIECEKKLKEVSKPLSQIDIIIQSAQLIKEFEEKQKVLEIKIDSTEQRLLAIEQNPHVNAEIQHFTIMGYCRNIGKQVGLVEASLLGRKCSAVCKELGFNTGHVNDPRFGSVKTYPLSVLEEIVK